MEDSAVAGIPEEVILKIFKLLDKSSLKEVALTCRTFRRISNEVPWTLKLTHVNQVGVDEVWAEVLLDCERRFTKVRIDESLELGRNHMIEIFAKHGVWVQELFLGDCVLDNSTIFVELLKSMPKLRKLIMLQTSTLAVFEDPARGNEMPKFEKLETIEIVKCEYRILEHFKTAQVKTLKVLDSMDGSRQPLEPLLNFLASQPSLKTFALRSIAAEESMIFKIPISLDDIPFKLQKLSLLGFKLQNEPNDYNNLLRFMQVHAKTIEELEIGRHFPDSIFEFIFSKFKKLKTLKICTKGIPTDPEAYERLEVNTSVTKLIISDESQANNEPLENFLVHLPNIETLVITDDFEAETLQFIATHCEKLRHLVIAEMKEVFNNLRFPLLETLHVDYVFEAINWAQFTAANLRIKELHIKTIEADMLNIGEISANLKLRIFRLGANFVTDIDFFDVIRQNCKDLEILTVHRGSIAIDESETADIKSLRFHGDEVFHCTEFADRTEGAFWDDKDYDGHLPEDDIESLGLDEMDNFDLHLMMEELGIIEPDDFDDEDNFFDGEDIDEYHGFY